VSSFWGLLEKALALGLKWTMSGVNKAGDHKGAKRRETQVRRALEEAVKKLGGPTAAAYKAGVTEQSIRDWVRYGRLDRVHAAQALKFARAAGVPLETLIVDLKLPAH